MFQVPHQHLTLITTYTFPTALFYRQSVLLGHPDRKTFPKLLRKVSRAGFKDS